MPRDMRGQLWLGVARMALVPGASIEAFVLLHSVCNSVASEPWNQVAKPKGHSGAEGRPTPWTGCDDTLVDRSATGLWAPVSAHMGYVASRQGAEKKTPLC